MRPRNEQEYEQRRQQIINGALEVFARKGFEKATNKEIAEAAGIGSAGLIYHYFADKGDLLRQVIEHRAPLFQLIAHPEAMMVLPPREALTLFAQRFLKIVENRVALSALKLMLGEAARNPEFAAMLSRLGPGRGLPVITRYLEHQMEAGTLRRMDAGAAARCFVGPLIAYILTRELFTQPDSATLTPDTMVETTVEIFLQGMEVSHSASWFDVTAETMRP